MVSMVSGRCFLNKSHGFSQEFGHHVADARPEFLLVATRTCPHWTIARWVLPERGSMSGDAE